jgi:uncharacterized membrane protein affecting hemolysin expression
VINLAFAIIRLITLLMEWRQQNHWMNEGEKRLQAQQLKDLTNALAKAADIDAEWKKLTDEEVHKRFEAEGWFAE